MLVSIHVSNIFIYLFNLFLLDIKVHKMYNYDVDRHSTRSNQ